ncbi:hypothetical protein POTOM_056102 [Populus tomentosa]|uniref:Transmembrane protein n=1 Tax=Populus tomentosa TaxID=118781 RepID=A0A8X8BY55_POPTO|nr:hypothetical protein POTOM_056102 [Populus tomentosa]
MHMFFVYYLCLLYVRSSLFFLGFFRSFVLSAFACFSPAFVFPSLSSVRSSWCALCVSFLLVCSVRGFSLFFSLSPFVLWFSRFALSPPVFLLFVLSSSFPLM